MIHSSLCMLSYWKYIVYLAFPISIAYYYLRLRKKACVISTENTNIGTLQDARNMKTEVPIPKPSLWYQNLFFQLQNLEDYPAVLEPARDELLAMLSRGVSAGLKQRQNSILSIEDYDAKRVWEFIEGEHERVMTDWEDYLQRRNQGHGPELFATLESARTWLTRQAPVKLVDGAWLAHVHKITTPFSHRGITKDAWQVFSEELGDGDISKHHVSLYHQLLEDAGCKLPEAHSAEFIQPHQWDDVENQGAWEAAAGQLVISLFPNEFLPEILGFNMQYEIITLDTMRAAYELKGLNITPNYFLIHISIDNADSGHAAMATHTVTRYLEMVRATEGELALKETWRRVQAGYTMSRVLGSHVSHEQDLSNTLVTRANLEIPDTPISPLSARMIDIIKAKALVSHKCHSQSRARIGSRSLSEWLAPSIWAQPSPLLHMELLKELSKAKPWVYAGESGKSQLLRELKWKGRMFGAFTNDEVTILTKWIDSLGPKNGVLLYWQFTFRKPLASKDVVEQLYDPVYHHPVVSSCTVDSTDVWNLTEPLQQHAASGFHSEHWKEKQIFTLPTNARLPDLIALWFADIGLLENTINTPSRTTSPLHASILRLLRAQAGFSVETDIVAGLDEMKRTKCLSLVDIGLELLSRADGTIVTKPSCLKDVFALTRNLGQGEESIRLTQNMLHWATRPGANLGWLLGLRFAFLQVKDAIARVPGLLEHESQLVLKAILMRERQSLEDCANWLKNMDELHYGRLVQGYQYCMINLKNFW